MNGYVETPIHPTARESIIDDILLADMFYEHGKRVTIPMTLKEFSVRKPILYNLMLEHIYMFLPCSEQYFKLEADSH